MCMCMCVPSRARACAQVEHLALMERSLGALPRCMLRAATCKRAERNFRHGYLRWPERAIDRESEEHVRAQRRLKEAPFPPSLARAFLPSLALTPFPSSLAQVRAQRRLKEVLGCDLRGEPLKWTPELADFHDLLLKLLE